MKVKIEPAHAVANYTEQIQYIIYVRRSIFAPWSYVGRAESLEKAKEALTLILDCQRAEKEINQRLRCNEN